MNTTGDEIITVFFTVLGTVFAILISISFVKLLIGKDDD